MQIDAYVYPGTNVLINHFDIRDAKALQEIEGVIFALKSDAILPKGFFDYAHLKAIHAHFFSEIYAWAGLERTVDIAKGESYFAHCTYITPTLSKLFLQLKNDDYLQRLDQAAFCNRLSFYFNEINAAHPFREGNGRTQRAFCSLLAENAGFKLDWQQVNHDAYHHASIVGFAEGNYVEMEGIFQKIISVAIPRELNITDNMRLEEPILKTLKAYAKKQLELTAFIQQKNQHSTANSNVSKELGKTIRQLNEELKSLASNFLKDPSLEIIAKPMLGISLHTQGGFKAIYEKLQTNTFQAEDISAVLQYAKNTSHSVSQSYAKKQNGYGARRVKC